MKSELLQKEIEGAIFNGINESLKFAEKEFNDTLQPKRLRIAQASSLVLAASLEGQNVDRNVQHLQAQLSYLPVEEALFVRREMNRFLGQLLQTATAIIKIL